MSLELEALDGDRDWTRCHTVLFERALYFYSGKSSSAPESEEKVIVLVVLLVAIFDLEFKFFLQGRVHSPTYKCPHPSNLLDIMSHHAFRGTDNLRCYVREAVLPEMLNGQAAPPMPIHGHKSHLNTLAIRPELYRKLESIYHFKDEMMDEAIAACKHWLVTAETTTRIHTLRRDRHLYSRGTARTG